MVRWMCRCSFLLFWMAFAAVVFLALSSRAEAQAGCRPAGGTYADQCFTNHVNACVWRWGATRPWSGGTAAIVSGACGSFCSYRDNGIERSAPGSTVSCTQGCPSGQQRFSDGRCAVPVQCQGGTVTPDNTCSCPTGQSNVNGACTPDQCPPGLNRGSDGICRCAIRNPQTQECAWNCAGLQGASFATLGRPAGHSSSQGCTVLCVNETSGPWPQTCYYTGSEHPEPGEGEPNPLAPPAEGTPEDPDGGESEPNEEPPAGSTEAPDQGDANSCPPGSKHGYVNEKLYCTPGPSTEPPPETNPTEADPTGLGPKLDEVVRAVDRVKQAVDQDRNAVQQQTSVLGGKLDAVAAAIRAQGPNVGGGGGDPGEPGEPGGAGECDPTAADYLQCLAGEGTPLEHTETSADTVADVMDQFVADIAAAPIMQAKDRLSGTMTVGSCPTASFQMFNRTFVIDAHCTLYESVKDVLSAVMRVGWVVLGLLILFSA